VVIWRHGRTEWNLAKRFQGSTDVPLDDVGRAQAARSARRLATLPPDLIVSSDLSRARETAEVLARLAECEVVIDPGLRETHAGAWEGLTNIEIQAQFPEEWAAWRRGEPIRRGGGGELDTEVAARVLAAIERTLEKVPPDGTLVVISHGGAGRLAIASLLGLPREHWSALGALSNCSWSVLGENTRGWRLLEHNAGTLPEPVLGDDQ
jgi:probable phosphoglycerate mutase